MLNVTAAQASETHTFVTNAPQFCSTSLLQLRDKCSSVASFKRLNVLPVNNTVRAANRNENININERAPPTKYPISRFLDVQAS